MSVLIKGIDLPRKCGECAIYVCYRTWNGDPGDEFCGITKEDVSRETKPDWCPLKGIIMSEVPEQLEIMPDGTLHITATVDVANINRILLSQTGTHFGDLYYKDDERKPGKWIVHYECPKCGEITKDFTEYCPFCSADMRGKQE